MLLSHAHRFIYTKTRKTAGTSVEIYFEEACIPPGIQVPRSHYIQETITPAGVIGSRRGREGHTWYSHMPARVIREAAGHRVWDEYFKFCVMRNPFDKLVSHWWFLVNKQEHPYEEKDFARIRSDFSAWCVARAPSFLDRDKFMIDDKVCMDYFIRYESLLNDLEFVCRRVGYPFRPERLGRYKGDYRAAPQPFEAYYDRPAIAAVQAAFSWELDYFGYQTLP